MALFYRKYLSKLQAWEKEAPRKPLIIRGARQTGKTALVRLFARETNQRLIELNFENLETQDQYKAVKTVAELEQQLHLAFNLATLEGTILFIDEIQELPHFIELLRFVKEERAEWKVIAAGSLLEPFIEKGGMSFPVGRVSFLEIHPVTFTEFALVSGKTQLVNLLNQNKPDKPQKVLHQNALNAFNEYLAIGGMPEAIDQYLCSGKKEGLQSIYADLLIAYREDIAKYASATKSEYLSFLINSMPGFAGTISAYTTIGQNQYRHREMKEALDLLHSIYLISRITAAETTAIPLMPNINRQSKWLYLDFGFLPQQAGIRYSFQFHFKSLSDGFRGRLLVQVVGQHLLALDMVQREHLHYWAKPKSKGEAEVDFCFSWQGKVVGIEVQSSRKPLSRSLISMYNQSENSILVQVDDETLAFETTTFNKKQYPFIRLPIYMVEFLPVILEMFDGEG